MQFAFLSTLLFLIILTGCGGGGGHSSSTQSLDSPVEAEKAPAGTLKLSLRRKVLLEKNFSNLHEFKENLNSYVLSAQAESGHFLGARLVCRRENYSQQQDLLSTDFDDRGQGAEVIVSLTERDPVDTEFSCQVRMEGALLEEKKLTLKKSFIVRGVQNAVSLGITGSPSIGTLLFEEGSVLLSDSLMLSLKIEHLISQNGKIVTFLERKESEIRDNEPGLSAGTINIISGTASGSLHFELRGLNAGMQTHGFEEKISLAPAQDGFLKDRACEGHSRTGLPGAQGRKGHNGYAGGNTGNLVFRVLTEPDIKLSLKYFPGKGGVGGAGGPGFPGGPGEPVFLPRIQGGTITCKAGAQGPTGPQGENGDSGASGQIQSSQIILGNQTTIRIESDWTMEISDQFHK
jgi:hypothetical protein